MGSNSREAAEYKAAEPWAVEILMEQLAKSRPSCSGEGFPATISSCVVRLLTKATGSVPALAGIVGVSAPASETTAVVKRERRNQRLLLSHGLAGGRALPSLRLRAIFGMMQRLDLTDNERAVLITALRRLVDFDPRSLSPQTHALKAILERLEPHKPQPIPDTAGTG